ncbi:MAG: hypothetical protein ACYSW3_29420, partial [Planctomycetota bacterium]
SFSIVYQIYLDTQVYHVGIRHEVEHASKTHFFPPFWETATLDLHSFSPIFSSSTHHPGLAGTNKKRNCLIRSRISRKSTLGTATSTI